MHIVYRIGLPGRFQLNNLDLDFRFGTMQCDRKCHVAVRLKNMCVNAEMGPPQKKHDNREVNRGLFY